MERIVVRDGNFEIPAIFEGAKVLRVTTSWSKQVRRYCKDGHTLIKMYFRSRDSGDKPYIPSGFIEINGIRYEEVMILTKETGGCSGVAQSNPDDAASGNP